MPPALTSTLSLLALLLALSALVLATIANRRWAQRPRRSAEQVPAAQAADASDGAADRRRDQAAAGIDDLHVALDGLHGALDGLRERTDLLAGRVDEVAAMAQAGTSDPSALRHVAVVRYDAFADVGGRLSYSVALLDDTHSGLVITTLAGKADVRTYVRTVSGGRGDGTLTAEEQQAIDAAGRRQ